MENDLVCNYKKCKKRLESYAWVTTCSHIFCDDDGARELIKNMKCPACDTNLSNKLDIIHIDLQLSDRYKSMVLAGQKPETILEVCTRAMEFWCYQTTQEKMYQEYQVVKTKEKITELEQYYESVLSRMQTDITGMKNQLTASRKEAAETKKKLNELSDKMSERNRQFQKLQSMYDGLRRKVMAPTLLEGAGDIPVRGTPRKKHSNYELPIGVHGQGDGSVRSHSIEVGYPGQTRNHSPAERDFALRPQGTPIPETTESRTMDVPVGMLFDMGLGGPQNATRARSHKH